MGRPSGFALCLSYLLAVETASVRDDVGVGLGGCGGGGGHSSALASTSVLTILGPPSLKAIQQGSFRI